MSLRLIHEERSCENYQHEISSKTILSPYHSLTEIFIEKEMIAEHIRNNSATSK